MAVVGVDATARKGNAARGEVTASPVCSPEPPPVIYGSAGEPPVQVTFWGTRGSIAKAGPSTLRYGGNTSCVAVRSASGTLLVLDCGTGAHGLGQALIEDPDGPPAEGHLLISHTHWDHIQGLPFFAPLFEPDTLWHVYGPRGLAGSLSETLAGQMEYSYFPVTIEQLAATVDYHDLVEGTLEIGDVTVHTRYTNHPALTLAYRIEADGASVVYASDHEPNRPELAAGGDVTVNANERDHVAFLQDADLLIHDAQYLAEEYPAKVGWGHSTAEYAVALARAAAVRRLVLFHHDPARADDRLDALLARARDHADQVGFGGEVAAATEGETIDLQGASSVRPHGRPARPGPALAEPGRSVLLAVSDPDVADILRQAAEAENLEVRMTTDRDEAVRIARRERPAIVVLDDLGDDATLVEFGRAIGELEPDAEREISLIGITTTGRWPPDAEDISITDSLVWPASHGYIRTKLRAWLLRRACRWQNAPLPPDEDERLESLHRLDVLDTEPEERFDRLTAVASNTLDVPVALISLIDADRQWFKSHYGSDAKESPRDLAFCAHAIHGDEPLVVPDALADPRFADNPLVADHPRVRFYAGVP